MANKKYEETDIQAIAEAIREKTGSEESFKVRDMASGVNEVYEAGKKAEYDEFWDSYQNYGVRRYYKYGFAGDGWNDKTFKPKYDIITTNGQGVFQECRITDLKGCLAINGVKLDFKGCSSLTQTFYGAEFLEIPEINIPNAKSLTEAFMLASAIKIDKIILPENGVATFIRTFSSTTKLTSITFEGVIGRNISFSSSPLSVESMKSVITHLKDYSGTTSEFAYSLTLSSACITALDAEGATSPNSNTWREYATDLGWNIN